MHRTILMLGAAIVVLVSLLIGTAVFAQDAAPGVARSSIWFDLWQILQPLVVLFFSIVGPVLVGWIGAQVIKLLKITDQAKKLEVEGLLRGALHEAAQNAVRFAITKAGLHPGAVLSARVIDTAVDYVISKNPDTLRKLDVGKDTLRDIILSKVPNIAPRRELAR